MTARDSESSPHAPRAGYFRRLVALFSPRRQQGIPPGSEIVTADAPDTPKPGFFEERTGWKRLKEVLLLEPLPGGARWAVALGSLLLFAFLVQVVTGILLAMNYAPSEKTAWPSVNYIQEEVPLGAF